MPAISAATALDLGDVGAEVDDRQRVARLDRGEHRRAASAAHLLGALALVGREQHAEAVLVGVERLLQMADGDLRRDLDEVDDAAPVGQVEVAAQVALLEVEVDDAHRPPGRGADGGHGQLERHRRRPDAPLAPGHRDQLAAERPGGRLLPRHAVAQRPRPLGGRAHAALELLERERQRDDVPQPRLHGGAQQIRRVLGRDEDQADLRKGLAELAREVERGHRPERVVQHDDVDVVAAQRARDLLRLVDHRHHLEVLPLLRQRRGARGDVRVGDREQEAVAHWLGSGSGSRW